MSISVSYRPGLTSSQTRRANRPESSRMPVWVSRTVVPIWSRKRTVATAFPIRLFKGIAVESSRSPKAKCTSGRSLRRALKRAMSSGLCCPSLSIVRTQSPACIHSRQCPMPVISATPFPRFLSWVSKVTPG